jgi:hypothetical protein
MHDTKIVSADMGEKWATCDLADRPNVFGNRLQPLVNLKKAPIMYFNAPIRIDLPDGKTIVAEKLQRVYSALPQGPFKPSIPTCSKMMRNTDGGAYRRMRTVGRCASGRTPSA